VIRSKKRGVTESAKAANGGLAYADELQQRFSAIRFVFITGWLDSSRSGGRNTARNAPPEAVHGGRTPRDDRPHVSGEKPPNGAVESVWSGRVGFSRTPLKDAMMA